MKNKLAVLAALCALFAMMFASPQVIASCREGLRLCCGADPALAVPFFVLSPLLGKLGFPGAGPPAQPGDGEAVRRLGCRGPQR